MPVRLTAALTGYPHTEALTSGAVTVPGYDIDFSGTLDNVVAIFRTMSRELRWDLSEMEMTTALCAKEYQWPFTALPVFVTRRFDHESISYNANCITEAKELEGKKIAMRSPNVPDVLWSLAVLQDTYGVDLHKIEWIVTGDEHIEQVVVDDRCTLAPGEDLEGLVESGEVAAIMARYRGSSPDVRAFVTDSKAAELEWYERYGYIPIHHTVVVKNDLLREHPDLATGLYDALASSKQAFLDRLAGGEDVLATMERPRHAYGFDTTAELVNPADPVPYGIDANRPALEALLRYAHEQGMLSRPYEVEDLFTWS